MAIGVFIPPFEARSRSARSSRNSSAIFPKAPKCKSVFPCPHTDKRIAEEVAGRMSKVIKVVPIEMDDDHQPRHENTSQNHRQNEVAFAYRRRGNRQKGTRCEVGARSSLCHGSPGVRSHRKRVRSPAPRIAFRLATLGKSAPVGGVQAQKMRRFTELGGGSCQWLGSRSTDELGAYITQHCKQRTQRAQRSRLRLSSPRLGASKKQSIGYTLLALLRNAVVAPRIVDERQTHRGAPRGAGAAWVPATK